MAGPGRAVRAFADPATRHWWRSRPGYMSPGSGSHRRSQPPPPASPRPAASRPGIAGEILVGAELGRIDEDRGGDMIGLRSRSGSAPCGRHAARPWSARERSCAALAQGDDVQPRAGRAHGLFARIQAPSVRPVTGRGSWRRAGNKFKGARGMAQAAFHHLRQRKGRHRQVDHRSPCRRGARLTGRTGRGARSRSAASARWPAISRTAPRRCAGGHRAAAARFRS